MGNKFEQIVRSLENLHLTQAVTKKDKVWVDVTKYRGSNYDEQILKRLGINIKRPDKMILTLKSMHLFLSGHRGIGKSSELKRIKTTLEGSEKYLVLLINIDEHINLEDFDFSTLLFLISSQLFRILEKQNIKIDPIHFENFETLFTKEEIIENTTVSEELKTNLGLQASIGLPGFFKGFIENAHNLKTGNSKSKEITTTIKNDFNRFKEAFNQLLAVAEEQLKEKGIAQRLLFIIDGTDRLNTEQIDFFLSRDMPNLNGISSYFIYVLNRSIADKNNQIYNYPVVKIPMIKIKEFGSTNYNEDAVNTLVEFVTKRVHIDLFENKDVPTYLIKQTGTHLRDIIRVCAKCIDAIDENEEKDLISEATVNEAIRETSYEYKHQIEMEDYKLLVEIDHSQSKEDTTPNNDRTRRLLSQNIIFSYNSEWWQTNPIVRNLKAYKDADDTVKT